MKANYVATNVGQFTDGWRLWTTILAAATMWFGAFSADSAEVPQDEASGDKTLVAWASSANLNQQGGSVLTIQDDDRFDAIVFGERACGKWMAGSNFFRRTQTDQNANWTETAGPHTLVQMAIVYEGDGSGTRRCWLRRRRGTVCSAARGSIRRKVGRPSSTTARGET